MATPRRDFLKSALPLGLVPGLIGSSAAADGLAEFLDQKGAEAINPDFDRQAYDFWSSFLNEVAEPVALGAGMNRGGKAPFGQGDLRPVFLRYGPEGFKNAVEVELSGLIPEGDVSVSLNTSTLKLSPEDQEKFEDVQNAQVRVDVHQKSSILPVIEAMGYTVVSGITYFKGRSQSQAKSAPVAKSGAKAPATQRPSGGKGGSIQSVAIESDAAWQKMQNILLPGGEGRWALNLEAQKKDSLLSKVLQYVLKVAGQLTPVISLPGITMTALQSFNNVYGAIHAMPIRIIESKPLPVFATQEAVLKTGAPGAATGIILRSGTYILMPANRVGDLDALKGLTVMQGRIVPPKTNVNQLDAAALDTLRDVTYVTFDVGVSPTTILPGGATRRS